MNPGRNHEERKFIQKSPENREKEKHTDAGNEHEIESFALLRSGCNSHLATFKGWMEKNQTKSHSSLTLPKPNKHSLTTKYSSTYTYRLIYI